MSTEEPDVGGGTEASFGSSISSYVGQTLRLTQADGEFDLKFENELLGRVTRPDEAYLVETRDGSWRLTHPARSVAHIDATDPDSGAEAATYHRARLGSGGTIEVAGGTKYKLRYESAWAAFRAQSGGRDTTRQLTGPDGVVLTLLSHPGDGYIEVTPVAGTVSPSELSLLALLSAYVVQLDDMPPAGQ